MTDMPMARYCGKVEAELFRVQCKILDLGTDTSLDAPKLRKKLMKLRDEIIAFRDQ